MVPPTPRPPRVESELLTAVLSLSRRLDLGEVLQRLVEAAPELTGAAAAALNVLDGRGVDQRFFLHGTDPDLLAGLERLQHAGGLMMRIPAQEPLILDRYPPEMAPPAPSSGGRAAPTPPEPGSFLGASVQVRHVVFAHLYLVGKPGGFTQADGEIMAALATSVGVAIENAQLYQASQRREHWLSAGQEITTMLLSGAEEEEALGLIAERARAVAEACTAVLVLPSVGEQLVIEIADGKGADQLIGLRMPSDGRSHTVLTEGIGMIVDSLAAAYTLRVAQLRDYGPALYAPLRTLGRGVGVLVLLREIGAPSFDQADLTTAESFAAHAALALVLSEARHNADLNTLVKERERIARDLHDLAIQQLFATGIRLESARKQAAAGARPEGLEATLSEALDSIDSTVREIRTIVSHLRSPSASVMLTDRLRHEASLARWSLGFAPSLVISLDGETVTGADDESSLAGRIEDLIADDLADDVVAVAREGLSNAARHAKAQSVTVTVAVESPGTRPLGLGAVMVAVEDDGVGLDPETDRISGLNNLAGRARVHGGDFEIRRPAGGQGVRLVWMVPLEVPID
ncbi:MAG: GAF domain-containing protein [Bifidobacteriaceae bacterium]|jgi:signal transduction histidine kinase|nr:GAF domain-containing protein [Bifidobacteriaceae bacterium]